MKQWLVHFVHEIQQYANWKVTGILSLALLLVTLPVIFVQSQAMLSYRTILNDVWDKGNKQLMGTPWGGGLAISQGAMESETTIWNDVYDQANHMIRVSGGGGGGGSGGSFDEITTGSNTGQVLTVGNGSSLLPSGTGTVTANALSPSYIIPDANVGDLSIYATGLPGSRCVETTPGGALTVATAACSAGGGPAGGSFDTITTGTNTNQTLTVGNGSALTTSGTGTITATALAAGYVIPDTNIADLNSYSTGLTGSRCVETTPGGALTVAAEACGAGGTGGAGTVNPGVNGNIAVYTGSTTVDDAPAIPANSLCTTGSICAGYQASLGFTPENVGNKSTSTSLGTSDALYPTQNAVKVYSDTKVDAIGNCTDGACGTAAGTGLQALSLTGQTTPSTPASGRYWLYADTTTNNVVLMDASGGVRHGVQTTPATASYWVHAIGADGSVTKTQPAFADITGLVDNAQMPPVVTGVDIQPVVVAIPDASPVVLPLANAHISVMASMSQNTTFNAPGNCSVRKRHETVLTSSVIRTLTWDTASAGGFSANAGLPLPTATTGSGIEDHLVFHCSPNLNRWVLTGSTIANTPAGGGGGGYTTIQEEGVSLTQRSILSFLGTGVTCGDNIGTGKTECIFTGGAAPSARRDACFTIGADNGPALIDTDIGPQLKLLSFSVPVSIQEIRVAADGGTPSIVLQKRTPGGTGTPTPLLSSALATSASGADACAKTTAVAGIDGVTTCAATLQNNTALPAGTWIGATSGVAGGIAKAMHVCVVANAD